MKKWLVSHGRNNMLDGAKCERENSTTNARVPVFYEECRSAERSAIRHGQLLIRLIRCVGWLVGVKFIVVLSGALNRIRRRSRQHNDGFFVVHVCNLLSSVFSQLRIRVERPSRSTTALQASTLALSRLLLRFPCPPGRPRRVYRQAHARRRIAGRVGANSRDRAFASCAPVKSVFPRAPLAALAQTAGCEQCQTNRFPC